MLRSIHSTYNESGMNRDCRHLTTLIVKFREPKPLRATPQSPVDLNTPFVIRQLSSLSLARSPLAVTAEALTLGRPPNSAMGRSGFLVTFGPLGTAHRGTLQARGAASEAVGGRSPMTVAPV